MRAAGAARPFKPCEILIMSILIPDPMYTLTEIGKILHRHPSTLSVKSRKLGFSKCPLKTTRNTYRGIGYNEVAQLHENNMTVSEIAKKLKTNNKTIISMHRRLSLRVNYKPIEKKKKGRPVKAISQAKIYVIKPDPEPEGLFLERMTTFSTYPIIPKTRISHGRRKRGTDCDKCTATWTNPCSGECPWLEKSIQMEFSFLPETVEGLTT